MNLFNKIIYKKSISNELKDIKNLLIKECLSQRNKRNKSAFNFNVDSQYTNYLYNIFYNISKNHLNNFTLLDVDFKLWCLITDKKFNNNMWHNHMKTSSINCVIYLQTQNKGINFKYKNKEIYYLPQDNDILIFPSFLDHLPEVSKKEPRITLNLELRCNEPVEHIFNI